MKSVISGFLFALMVGATPSMAQNAAPTCTVGQARPVATDGSEFRFDTLTVPGTPAAVRHMRSGTPAVDFALDLYKDVKAGRVERMKGAITVTYTLIGVRTSVAPTQVPFLSGTSPKGDGICRGYAQVTVAENRLVVTAETKGGEELGQLSFIFPTAPLRGIPDVLACVTWGVPVHVPRLTEGPMRGVENTLCGMPGTKPGFTLLGQRIAEGVRWALFPGIIKIN